MACQDFNIIFGLSFTRNIHSEIADKPAIYKQYSESRQYVPAESKDNFNMSKGKFKPLESICILNCLFSLECKCLMVSTTIGHRFESCLHFTDALNNDPSQFQGIDLW